MKINSLKCFWNNSDKTSSGLTDNIHVFIEMILIKSFHKKGYQLFYMKKNSITRKTKSFFNNVSQSEYTRKILNTSLQEIWKMFIYWDIILDFSQGSASYSIRFGDEWLTTMLYIQDTNTRGSGEFMSRKYKKINLIPSHIFCMRRHILGIIDHDISPTLMHQFGYHANINHSS